MTQDRLYHKSPEHDAAFCVRVRERLSARGVETTTLVDDDLVKILRAMQDADVQRGVVCSDTLAYVHDAVDLIVGASPGREE